MIACKWLILIAWLLGVLGGWAITRLRGLKKKKRK